MKILILFCVIALSFCSCNESKKGDTKYIYDTLTHEADSPLVPDKSMVPELDTADRNLDDPTTKKPDKMAR